MKVIGITTLVVSVFAMLSCGNGMDAMPETSSSGITAPAQQPVSANMSEATSDTDGNKNVSVQAPDLNSAALNPAHGQPGHRCDIGVGQPLNGKPATQSSTQINPLTTPATKPTPVLPSPLVNPGVQPASNAAAGVLPTTPGLNPRHGQPGHRCDIQVGQPLNSKPPITTPTTPSLTSPTLPAIAPSTNTATVAPGMNPPHGQPGHRCDIPVGKPLNSKPVQK